MNNALQKTIPRFFIGSFFIALLCAVIISEFVGEAFFMAFLIPIIVGLSLHFVDLNWDSTIDTIIGTYFLLGLPCTILGIVQLVLAVVCLPEMHK